MIFLSVLGILQINPLVFFLIYILKYVNENIWHLSNVVFIKCPTFFWVYFIHWDHRTGITWCKQICLLTSKWKTGRLQASSDLLINTSYMESETSGFFLLQWIMITSRLENIYNHRNIFYLNWDNNFVYYVFLFEFKFVNYLKKLLRIW